MKPVSPRIVLIGSWSVGKTSIINRIVHEKFVANLPNTTAAGYFYYKSPPPESSEFQIWDTAGMERFRSLNSVYFSKAAGAILVFDLTRYDSFKDLESWRSDFISHTKPGTPIILCGNKCDRESDIEVEDSEIEQYAKDHGMTFFKTSACTGEGIDSLIKELVKVIPESTDIIETEPIEKEKKGCC